MIQDILGTHLSIIQFQTWLEDMSKILQKGKEILNKYFSLYPQPEALRSFGKFFQLDYSSTNPTTNSKKTLRKLYVPENANTSGLIKESLGTRTLKYEEKPARIEVNGTWEGWLVDEKLHKDLYQDQMFGSAKLSISGNRWVYVAKVEPEKTKSYFNEGEGATEFVHDYGESYPGKTHNAIFVYDRESKKTIKIPNDNNYIVSSPTFLDAEGTKIIFHAYHRQNFGYGFVHCFNRAVSIYTAVQEGEEFKVTKFETNTRTNMFPGVSRCGNYLAYLSGNGRTHCFYMNITVLKRNGDAWEKYHQIDEFFIGSAVESKLNFYEIDGKPHFLCQTNQNASNVIYSFNIEAKSLSKVTNNTPTENYSIISFDEETNLLVVRYANPTTITFGYSFLPDPIQLIPSEQAGDYECEVLQEPIHHFVMRKKGAADKQPCVVLIHGGPHGASDATLTSFKYLFLESGYTILIPNFSGSTGYGVKYLENAIGKIGEVEGAEITECVKKLVASGKIDGDKVFSFGGSHGGFLGGILAGRHHEHFTANVLLNPVLSLPFMISTSDIPDWVMVEGLNKQDTLDHLTSEDYSRLYELSPISCPPQIPVCLLIGAKDRRVPHESAKVYVSIAKSKGVKAELYIYPESTHKLMDTVETEMDVLLKGYKFIEETKKELKQ